MRASRIASNTEKAGRVNMDKVKIEKIKAGVSGAEMIAQRQRMLNMKRKPCFYDGTQYDSLSALAHRLGVSKPTITRAVKAGEYQGKVVKIIKRDTC